MGEDYGHRTAMYSMDRALAEKEAERRAMAKTFDRDSPAQQAAVRAAYEADLKRQADAYIAGMRASTQRGASVAINEGELDSEPPTWLANYMDTQRTQDPRLAMRVPVGSARMGGR